MNGAAENANRIPKPLSEAGSAIGIITRTSIAARLALRMRVDCKSAEAQAKPSGMTMATETIEVVTLVHNAFVNKLLSKIAVQCRSVRLVNDIRAVQNGDTET